jgi:transcriptional regulator with XRE-family HTH domain
MADKLRGDAPHPVDLHVGRRLRALRKHAGLSLTALAGRMGVTYQQLQKYETGRNRLSAAAVYQACSALAAPVGALYEGLPAPDGRPAEGLAAVSRLDAVLTSPEGRDLVTAFLDMPHDLRRQYAALARRIVDPAEPAPALRRPRPGWGEGEAAPLRAVKGSATGR